MVQKGALTYERVTGQDKSYPSGSIDTFALEHILRPQI